jgi:hypothetical protein
MKSLGRIAYEEFCNGFYRHMEDWVRLEQKDRDAWDMAAQAVIDEYRRRAADDNDNDWQQPMMV